MENIYTIPVNEAFEDSVGEGVCCPFCLMRKRLEENELDLILGASMMEPDTRIKTNEQGFCPEHLERLLGGGKALPFALMMESHLEHIRGSLKGAGVLCGANAAADIKYLRELGSSCYICSRIDYHFTRMVDTAVYLWKEDPSFRKKAEAVKKFCYPHFADFAAAGKERLKGKDFSAFYKEIFRVLDEYTETLSEDISGFCRKFDYRYADEPWGNSKDAPERTVRMLSGDK